MAIITIWSTVFFDGFPKMLQEWIFILVVASVIGSTASGVWVIVNRLAPDWGFPARMTAHTVAVIVAVMTVAFMWGLLTSSDDMPLIPRLMTYAVMTTVAMLGPVSIMVLSGTMLAWYLSRFIGVKRGG